MNIISRQDAAYKPCRCITIQLVQYRQHIKTRNLFKLLTSKRTHLIQKMDSSWTTEKDEEFRKTWTISPNEDSKKKPGETGGSSNGDHSKNGGNSKSNN